jgi:hypothetical protein
MNEEYYAPLDSDSDSDSDGVLRYHRKRKFLMNFLAITKPQLFAAGRLPNTRKDREFPIRFIRSWTDSMFVRQFRLDRISFYDNVRELNSNFPINEQMGIRSSGSSISNELRLFITMRLLAGASYLDMIWYGVDVDHVHELFIDTLSKLDKLDSLDNIKLPTNEAEWS